MRPARRSAFVISPPASARPEAVAPKGAGTAPLDWLTLVIFAPHDACHPGVLSRHEDRSPGVGGLRACHRSHIVSVDGCQITMCLSVPAAGRADSGIGTGLRSRA